MTTHLLALGSRARTITAIAALLLATLLITDPAAARTPSPSSTTLAQGIGMRSVLVRTGKFRPDPVERSSVQPDGIISSIGQLPEWIEDHL